MGTPGTPISINCSSCSKPANFADITAALGLKTVTDKKEFGKNFLKAKNVRYFCDECSTRDFSATESKSESTVSSEVLDKLLHGFSELTDKLSAFCVQMADLQKEVAELKIAQGHSVPSPTSASSEELVGAVKEHFDRKERENNCVIYSLPENQNEDEDKAAVSSLVQLAGGTSDQIVEVFRLGKKPVAAATAASANPPLPRPIKVKFSAVWSKRALIFNQGRVKHSAAHLVNSSFFVRDDLTPKQRENDQKLRAELSAARAANPGKKLVIRNGQIIEKILTNVGGSSASTVPLSAANFPPLSSEN